MQRVGEFELKGELGRGAMGVVYRARDPRTGRDVAIKLLLQRTTRATARDRFRREGEVSAALQHPNVVRVHSAGEDESGRSFLAYELLERCRTLAETSELPLAERLRLLHDAARGLGHAHARGFTHRDVKAENILVTEDGVAKVTDFGIAAAVGLEKLTQTGGIVGTPSHMAPEQINGDRDVYGPPTDVWALGVLLYELLTGRLPFPGENLFELGSLIQSCDPPRPSELESSVSPDLETLCMRCLRLDPAQRYPDGDAFADDLRRCLDGEALSPAPRSAWRMALAGAAVLCALTVALGAATLPGKEAPAAGTAAVDSGQGRQRRARGETKPPPVRRAEPSAPLPQPKRVFEPFPLDQPLPGEKGNWIPALRAEATAGSAQALVDLAWARGAGMAVDKSYNGKVWLMHDAAHRGHPQAQCYMAYQALRGHYVEGGQLFAARSSPQIAAQWFRLAVASGDREAARGLLELLRSEELAAESHEIQRLERSLPAPFEVVLVPANFQEPFPNETNLQGLQRAEAGRWNSGSMLTIAKQLDSAGQRALALTVLHAAALHEQAEGLYRLAKELEKGILVDRDPAQAAYWYRRAAAHGHQSALRLLVDRLSAGTLEPTDPEELSSLGRRLALKRGALLRRKAKR